MNAMQDWKPTRDPGYTGRRHTDREGSLISITGIAFFTGIALGITITLGYMGV